MKVQPGGSVLGSVVLFLMLGLTAGCSKDDSPVTATYVAKEIMPLAVGDHWKYAQTLFDTAGNAAATDTDQISVVADSVIQNEHWFSLGSLGTTFITNRATGLWEYEQGRDSGPIIYLVYKYPAAAGDSVHVNNSTNSVVVVSADTAIATPIASYHCIEYRAEIQLNELGQLVTYVYDSFFAPNVGEVYYRVSRRDLAGHLRLVETRLLIAFHLTN